MIDTLKVVKQDLLKPSQLLGASQFAHDKLLCVGLCLFTVYL